MAFGGAVVGLLGGPAGVIQARVIAQQAAQGGLQVVIPLPEGLLRLLGLAVFLGEGIGLLALPATARLQ
ncbi:hypothetical protein, partial [Staphylococcus aureus]|uniref:hypothetical protein n=1 Tax=Staphylococcus aureus TaxID=1280 RepID=UPI00301D4D87